METNMSEVNIKQVIIIRRDLKMRRGKEIAQGAHASSAFMRLCLLENAELSSIERKWLQGDYTKVVCQVESVEALLYIYNEARNRAIEANLITDKGNTEFAGVPTITCCAIGPDLATKIDPITRNLKLY